MTDRYCDFWKAHNVQGPTVPHTHETRAGGEHVLNFVRRYAWVPVFVGASVVYVWRRVR